MIFLKNGDFRISIEQDSDVINPFEYDEGMGNFVTEKVNLYVGKEDAVWYKYNTYSGFRLTNDRDLVTATWFPNDVILEELKGLEGDARRAKCIFFAEQAIGQYNLWAEGECYGYIAEKKNHCDACGHDEWTEVESCWGFIGREYIEQEAQLVFDRLNKKAGVK